MIFNMAGGGASLNFGVVAYATEAALLAAAPKENTIGVVTTTSITSWIFSATEPVSPAAGMVWITTGTGSNVEFNAIRTNALQIYPIYAKQYVGSDWVNKTAKSYQNGAWVDWWDGTLYDSGNQYNGITGGWFSQPTGSNYVVFDSNNIRFVNGSGTASAAAIYTNKAIDISRFTKLRVKGSVTDFDTNSGQYMKFGVTSSNTTGYNPSFKASTTVSKTGSMDAVLDISGVSDGSYYIAIWAKFANFKITQIMLEV